MDHNRCVHEDSQQFPMGRPRVHLGLSTGCRWDAVGLPMGCPRVDGDNPTFANGFLMDCPWDANGFRGLPMGGPWDVRGLVVIAQRVPMGIPWGRPWVSHRMPMGGPWNAHESYHGWPIGWW